MNTFARLASATIFAVTTLAAPLTAMAHEGKAKPAHLVEGDRDSKDDKLQFPMNAAEFRKLVEHRIEQFQGHVKRATDKHNVPEAKRAELGKMIEAAVKDVKAAADKAEADGVVTKDEAKQVKAVSEAARARVREELGGKHARHNTPKAKAKGRAHKGA